MAAPKAFGAATFLMPCKTDEFVKSRHTREGGYPESLQLLEKTGFPIKDFGNDGLKTDFLRSRQNYSILKTATSFIPGIY